MARVRMHKNEFQVSPELMRQLIAEQFPQWADLPVELVDSYGTDHDIYRIGSELSARMPRLEYATAQATIEARWLPEFAPQLPVAVPVQLAVGAPGSGYPFAWSVYEWLPGANANGTITDHVQAAIDLAGFIEALQRIDTTGAHERAAGARGCPLTECDRSVRKAIAALGERVDGAAVTESWEQSLAAPAWDGADVWVHGDLLSGNLLMRDGRLSAVIDFGGLNVGDPAVELQAAWNLFDASPSGGRNAFRQALDVDDATWLRGRGWALCQAVMALPYYWDTNPGIIKHTSHALRQVLADGR